MKRKTYYLQMYAHQLTTRMGFYYMPISALHIVVDEKNSATHYVDTNQPIYPSLMYMSGDHIRLAITDLALVLVDQMYVIKPLPYVIKSQFETLNDTIDLVKIDFFVPIQDASYEFFSHSSLEPKYYNLIGRSYSEDIQFESTFVHYWTKIYESGTRIIDIYSKIYDCFNDTENDQKLSKYFCAVIEKNIDALNARDIDGLFCEMKENAHNDMIEAISSYMNDEQIAEYIDHCIPSEEEIVEYEIELIQEINSLIEQGSDENGAYIIILNQIIFAIKSQPILDKNESIENSLNDNKKLLQEYQTELNEIYNAFSARKEKNATSRMFKKDIDRLNFLHKQIESLENAKNL